MGLIVYGGDSPTVKLKEVKIRKDNDFKLMFLVERNGNPEDMEQASIVSLKLISPKAVETLLTPALIKENVIYLDIESTFNTDLGKYRLEMKYTVLDPEFTGGVRNCAVDTYAYTIVSTSSEATIIDELAKSVDVATGFQGKAFTFSMYTADQIAELQRPALEAAQSANIAKQAAINATNEALAAKDLTVVATTNANAATMHANASATLAQSKASEADHAAQQAVNATASVLSARDQILANEDQRNANETNRKTNESSRVAAESLRVESESERQFKERLRIEKEDIRKTAEIGRSSAESLRVTAETDRVQAENERKTSELTRQSSESERNENEGLRVEAENTRKNNEEQRVTAETNRQNNFNSFIEVSESAVNTFIGTAQGDINEAITNAENATENANNAASNADNAREAIQDDLALKANHGYDSSPKTLKEVDDDLAQLAGDVNLFKEESNLKDAIQDSKIKDIESIISTMNPNQSAQLSVSGASPLLLPKNAANGGMSVKLEGLTAENLIVDGSFEDGIYSHEFGYGTIVNDVYRVGSKSILFSANATAPYFSYNIICNATDKLYITTSYRLKSVTSYPSIFMLRMYDYGALTNPGVIQNLNQGQQVGVWYDYSFIVNGRSGGIRLIGGAINSGVIDFYFDNIKCINLTETFGAGNEPTKEQCDLIFSDYFEGVKSFVPTGRVRSVGKNVLDISSLKSSDFVNIGGGFMATLIPVVPNVTYTVRAYDIANLGNPNFYVEWRNGDMSSPVTFISPSYGFLSYNRVFLTDKMGFSISATSSNIDSRLEYVKKNIAIQIERSPAATTYEPYKETSLYLTAPELRSNGAVKDEIRKGANGYEMVKRVGVGTSNGEIVINGDFSTADNWTVLRSIISDGTLKIVADAELGAHATQDKTITAGKIYRYSINVLGITGILYLFFGSNLVRSIRTVGGIGVYTGFFIPSANATYIRLIKESSAATNAEIDSLSIIEYNPAEGVAMAGGEAVFGSNVHYTLANPVISPISYGGILNSAENGTVYHEPVVADAGVYGTNLPILMQDYPIATIEEIIKHENGVDTYLNAATAVIASDGLSFTHPDLTDGDLVLFTYAYSKENVSGNITASFYDSNVVKIDTVTGKAYKINEVVTNGVLTRTLTEV